MLITTYQKRNTPYILNYIYSGQLFNFFEHISGASSVNYLIKTSNTGKIFHMIGRQITSDQGQDPICRIYEGTVVSANGTALTSITNHERRSTKTADTLFYKNPTITSNGTLIDELFLVTANDVYSYPGLYSTGLSEMVFKKNTNYLLTITLSLTVDFCTNIDFFESGN